MERERLEFKTTIARIDAGVSSGDIYDLLTKGFKGYENYTDSELEKEYLQLTGKIVEIGKGI